MLRLYTVTVLPDNADTDALKWFRQSVPLGQLVVLSHPATARNLTTLISLPSGHVQSLEAELRFPSTVVHVLPLFL